MLSRLMNYIAPATNSNKKPGDPIRKLADEATREDTYSYVLSQFMEVDIPQQTFPTQDPVIKLHQAVQAGDLDAVKDLIERQGVPIESVMAYGHYTPQSAQTPLFAAVMFRKWDVIRYLLEKGADVNFRQRGKYYSDHGDTPLAWLATMAMKTPEAEMRDYHRTEARMEELANAKPLFEYAMTHNRGDLNSCNHSGVTILHTAIRVGDKEMFDYCLQQGVDPEIKPKSANGNEETPLCIAARYHRVEMAEELLQRGVDVEGREVYFHDAPLAIAACNKNGALMIELLLAYHANLNRRGQNGNTALHSAIRSGDAANVKALLDAGANLYAQDSFNKSPLDIFNKAVEWNHKHPDDKHKNHDGTVNPSDEMIAVIDAATNVTFKSDFDLPDDESSDLSSDEENQAPRLR